MNPEHSAAARQPARDAGKQVGQWIEEAITEKREREQEAKDVNAAGLLRNWESAPPTCLTWLTGSVHGGRICISDTWVLLALLLTVRPRVLTMILFRSQEEEGIQPRMCWSGWGESNSRLPAPKAGALPLGYTPIADTILSCVAARERSNVQNFWIDRGIGSLPKVFDASAVHSLG